VKRADVGKNIVLEIQGDARRIRVAAEVCFREGALEMLMCRKNTKEHESLLRADIDARQLHAALLLAGAKAGSPVRYEPKYAPASGTTIKVTLEYQKDGKAVTVPGQGLGPRRQDPASDATFMGVCRQRLLSESG